MTSTVPAICGGDTALIDVEETTLNEVAGTVPNVTPVAPMKFVPVIVTEVPPAVVPVCVLRALTVGTEATV
jgi:hypothetical protein